MKKHRWLFVVLGVLSLVLISCAVIAVPQVNVPGGGLRTSDGELELTGTGLPGYPVQVVAGDQVLAVTTISEDGTWALDVSLTEPGEHQLQVQVLNTSGLVIGEAAPIGVTMVGEAAVSAVVEAEPPTVELPGGAELEAGDVALSGNGEPGSKIQVLVDGRVAGVADVGTNGTWSLVVSITEVGDHELTVQTLDASGEVVAEAEPVSISLTGEAMLEEAPPAATSETVAPEILFPVDGADILTGQLTLIGSGGPGDAVEILDSSTVLGTAEVGADGEWRHSFEPEAGTHELAVRPAADTTSPEGAVEVTVTSDIDSVDCWSNPGIDRGETFIVGTCDTLEDISKLKGIDLDELIAANPQIENPDMVYPGDIVTIP